MAIKWPQGTDGTQGSSDLASGALGLQWALLVPGSHWEKDAVKVSIKLIIETLRSAEKVALWVSSETGTWLACTRESDFSVAIS